jgi:hypothetical protein
MSERLDFSYVEIDDADMERTEVLRIGTCKTKNPFPRFFLPGGCGNISAPIAADLDQLACGDIRIVKRSKRISCAFSLHHVRHIDVLLGPSNIDLRTAEAARTPVWHLCRQLAARFPHGMLPCLMGTVLPVLIEVASRDLGRQPTPCRFKSAARHIEALGRSARAQAAM